MPRGKSESIVWTGKNLAAVKAFHKHVAHYPAEKGETFARDHSQHPDNLHIESEGRTLVAALGDTLVRDEDGRITVEQTGKSRPTATPAKPEGRVIDAEGREGGKTKGGSR